MQKLKQRYDFNLESVEGKVASLFWSSFSMSLLTFFLNLQEGDATEDAISRAAGSIKNISNG